MEQWCGCSMVCGLEDYIGLLERCLKIDIGGRERREREGGGGIRDHFLLNHY